MMWNKKIKLIEKIKSKNIREIINFNSIFHQKSYITYCYDENHAYLLI